MNHGTLNTDPLFSPHPKPAHLRRAWKSPWVAGAAALLVVFVYLAAFFLPAKLTQAPVQATVWESYTTDYGEQKSAQLADGSEVELNTNTQLRVNRASSGREVILDQGEVLFAVKHDPDHPFLVRVGTDSVRALGTLFSVWRKSDEEAVTLVKEGAVRVTAVAYPSQEVFAEHTATLSPSGVRVEAMEPAKMDRKFSWRKGELAFNGETLAEVVEAFNRYNRLKLKIDDPHIAQQRIGGTFRANDPQGFAELLEHTFGFRHARDESDGSQLQIIHLSGANH